MDQVEEVKRKTDIIALISEYTELKKAGRNFKGLCPFHTEKTPSFTVTPELQIFKCFGCGIGGDSYKFLMEIEKIDFPQALKILADRAGIKLISRKGFATFQEKDELHSLNLLAAEFYHYLLTKHPIGEKARVYLKNRGIKDEAISAFKLGYSPEKEGAVFDFLTKKRGYQPQLLEKAGIVVKARGGFFDRFRGRIIFPLLDHFGNVIGFAGRVIETKGDMAKYINSPETLVYKKSQTLYGLDVAKQEIKKLGFAILVEGEIDCISCWQAGIMNVVAIKGSAVTQEQGELLARFTNRVVLALDADFAGNEAARRGLDILEKQELVVQIANLGKFKDPDEAAQKDPEALVYAISQAQGVYDFLINLVLDRVDVTTTEGKLQVSRQLTPILARIEDEIVRASCIKTVAQRLGVSEEAVIAQVRKNPRETSTVINQNVYTEIVKTRRDLLEENLLSLILVNTPADILEMDLDTLIKSQARLRLIGEIREAYKKNPKADLETISQSLSPELKDSFAAIILLESLEYVEKEVDKVKNELDVLDIKEKMAQIMQQIKTSETQEQTQKVVNLEGELTRLGERLALLEA